MASGPHVLIVFLLTANAFTRFIMMQRSFPPSHPVRWKRWTDSHETLSVNGATNNRAAWLTAFSSNFLLSLGFPFLISRMRKVLGFCELSIILSSSLCSTVFPNAQILHYLRYTPPHRFSVSFFNIWDRMILTKSGEGGGRKLATRRVYSLSTRNLNIATTALKGTVYVQTIFSRRALCFLANRIDFKLEAVDS